MKNRVLTMLYLSDMNKLSLLMYIFMCKPSTMYINEITSGPFCHSQTC